MYNNNELCEKKTYIKESKYTNEIKEYICKYVTKAVNFDYNKLIGMINKKFNIESKKSKYMKY